jgi:hypothetical protein
MLLTVNRQYGEGDEGRLKIEDRISQIFDFLNVRGKLSVTVLNNYQVSYQIWIKNNIRY